MKKVFLLGVLITLMSSLIYYIKFADYYKLGENDTIEVKAGQEFHIKLDENPSTGYINCWLNEKNSFLLKKTKKEYVPSLNSRLGYVGSGGTIDFTFKACSLIDGQKCSDYNSENTQIDHEFIIKITN